MIVGYLAPTCESACLHSQLHAQEQGLLSCKVALTAGKDRKCRRNDGPGRLRHRIEATMSKWTHWKVEMQKAHPITEQPITIAVVVHVCPSGQSSTPSPSSLSLSCFCSLPFRYCSDCGCSFLRSLILLDAYQRVSLGHVSTPVAIQLSITLLHPFS